MCLDGGIFQLGVVMPVLETLEQRGLFRLTRFVAFIVVLFLTCGLIIGGVAFMGDFLPNHESHVSYSTIASELHPRHRAIQVPRQAQKHSQLDRIPCGFPLSCSHIFP
jgi:predicted PurR-regulated permease PerM